MLYSLIFIAVIEVSSDLFLRLLYTLQRSNTRQERHQSTQYFSGDLRKIFLIFKVCFSSKNIYFIAIG